MLGRVYYNDKGDPERISGTAIDVTTQIVARQKLHEEQQHAQLLLNSIPAIAWTNEPNGEVNFYNQRWYDYTGLTFEETKAWGWREVIHPDDLQYNLETYAEILSGETGGSFEVREKNADGLYRWHLVNIEPIKDGAGKIVQWIGTATDIQRLKELEKQKDEFISIASHELKTPLTSVKAFNQMMLRTDDQKTLIGLASRSNDHIRRLEKLIKDLLDVSRITSGKLNYDMQDVDIEKILTESIESIQITTQKHRIILNSCDKITFQGDPNRLEQVMNNLLNNAIKYSPQGGDITVACSLDDSGIVVSVTDEGIGIEKQHLHKLFDRYYRIDNTAMRFSGLGLGLYITSEIIKRHNGSMWIESEYGKGSIFSFRLPILQTDKVEVDVDDHFRDASITISYDAVRHWVICVWHGYQNIVTVKRSCLRLLAMATKFKVTKILADNTFVEGSWTDATDWVGKEFYPLMDTAGIRQLAWVHSKSAFSQLAAERTIDMVVGAVVTKFFDSVRSAEIWLER
ncbi:sensor histidine kinase [Mucilaginibacter sp. KACC 22063]|uniref:sensor histidine kinase n=1 Tax=Mucilaginibacter sp. KACC 22063 TaxID=3025666 RepID=UPI002366A41B|nr:PAS domain-containing sensor histidine kinase [Mucilaginibacter sp. KACC 22063]WDF57169.1 PAS domain-containing sensor histidine kinase [Mucilaginibacter sp. KACC 22063]